MLLRVGKAVVVIEGGALGRCRTLQWCHLVAELRLWVQARHTVLFHIRDHCPELFGVFRNVFATGLGWRQTLVRLSRPTWAIRVVFLKDADATRWWVPSYLKWVDHHVDSWDVRSVHEARLVDLGGQLWEELEELRLASLDLQLMVVVKLDKVFLECAQMRRHGRKVIRRHNGVLQARGGGRRIALLPVVGLSILLVLRPVLLARPPEAIERHLHLILLPPVILAIAFIEKRDRRAPFMVGWKILLIYVQVWLACRANLILLLVAVSVFALIVDHCDEVLG